jgi:hypothetical protein
MEVITKEVSRACGIALDRLYSLRFERIFTPNERGVKWSYWLYFKVFYVVPVVFFW